MKNILSLVLSICLLAGGLFAQSPSVESFYDRYADDEKVSNVTIKGWLLDIATQFTEDVESNRVLSKITQLRVLLMEDGNPVTKSDYRKLKKDLKKDDFEELLQVRDQDSLVDFYIREDGDHISNVLMLVNEKDGFVLLSLEGLLKLEDLKNIKIDTDGAEHFKKIGKKKTVPRA